MINLNLLPDDRRAAIDVGRRARAVLRLMAILVLIVTLNGAALMLIQLRLTDRDAQATKEYQSSIIVSPSGKTLPILETTRRLNRRLTALQPLLETATVISPLVQLPNHFPKGIYITSLSLSSKTRQVVARGIAQSRNDIPTLQKNFEESEFFSDVKIKSNINDRTNIPFDLTATVK